MTPKNIKVNSKSRHYNISSIFPEREMTDRVDLRKQSSITKYSLLSFDTRSEVSGKKESQLHQPQRLNDILLTPKAPPKWWKKKLVSTGIRA